MMEPAALKIELTGGSSSRSSSSSSPPPDRAPRPRKPREQTAARSATAATAKKGGRSPFAGQGGPFSGAAVRRTGGDRDFAGERRGSVLTGAAGETERVRQGQASREGPSIESEVTKMLDESKGTLRLAHDGLGDERVPSLTLEGLKEVYRTGRGSVCSWRATASSANEDQGRPVTTALIKVEEDRLGVLSSHEAYLVEFKETRPSSAHISDPARHLTRVDEDGAEEGFQLVYLWIGSRAGVEACEAARAQGKRMVEQYSSSASQTPLLEVEQGCEPALFLALFSYMLPPLAAVVLQGQDETPDLRVLEIQESPCLQGSGIVIAVEGPCSASLLAQHGPLPGRSYICLVRPRRRRLGCSKGRGRGGAELDGGGSVGTFDAAYYWHGVGEAPAVEEVGILLCQQVDRMFPSPSPDYRGKRRRRRRPGGVGLGGGMMRGYVVDVKLGLPVPDGFWACLLPERPIPSSVFASHDRRLLSQDLRPECRTRPVRVFGVCAGSKKARQSFVWEVTSGGMPSQMRLSPSLSHVVDAGASRVYVWHGIGSSRDDCRLAWRVASAYAARVQGRVSVEQADAGSEPVGLLDCFIGWNQALVEPPPMLLLSPGRRLPELDSNADLSSLNTPTSTEGQGSMPAGHQDHRRSGRRSSSGRGASSGSVSSGSRLTPPGQRTPSLSLASPPSLKNLAGAAPSASGSSGSSSSPLDRSDDDSLHEGAAHPPAKAAPGKWASPDLERNSSCAGGAKGVGSEYPKNAVRTCGGGRGESGPGNDDTRREPSRHGGRCKDERKGDGAGESAGGGDKEAGDPGRQQGSGRGGDGGEGGGRESSDDGEGIGSNGSGNQGAGKEEIEEDEDEEEEAMEGGGDEEMDTFLRLSEVDFCEGIDVLQLGGTSVAARDSWVGGSSRGDAGGGGGGDESVSVIPRHLSDFFRSPLALDSTSTPKHRSSSIRSLSDVQTGARLFNSVKSTGSDDDGTISVRASGNLCIPAFSGTVSSTPIEATNNVLINCVGSPPSSASPVADAAADVPDTGAAAEIAAPPSDAAQHSQTAEFDVLPAEKSDLFEPAIAETADGPREPEQADATEEGEETAEPDSDHGDESIGDDGGGESEEEWLTGDVAEPALEKRSEDSLHVTPTSTQEAEPKAEKTAGAAVGTVWAGLNDDGSWRTEVARKAAGKAGEVEAERRRLATIISDESWRSDARETNGPRRRSGRKVRRESVKRLQTGNVRNKLNAFQGSSGSNAGKETADNRSSIGALHGRGLVTAWTKKCTVGAPAGTTAQAVPPSAPAQNSAKESLSRGDDPPTPGAEERTSRSPIRKDSTDEQGDEFVWKAGPAPCRLQGRPSLGLIRNGQVRIMTKALLLSCPEGGDEEAGEICVNCEEVDTNHNGNSSSGSIEPQLPSRPPPTPPRVQDETPPPLPERPSAGCSNSPGQRPLPARPLPARPLPARPLPAQPSAGKGNFWLAKAGLTRKKRDGVSPASAPATPPRNGCAWQQGGGTLTPPPTYATGRADAGVAAAAKVLDAIGSRESPSGGATGAWAKLRRRLEVEGENFSGEGRAETISPGISSGIERVPQRFEANDLDPEGGTWRATVSRFGTWELAGGAKHPLRGCPAAPPLPAFCTLTPLRENGAMVRLLEMVLSHLVANVATAIFFGVFYANVVLWSEYLTTLLWAFVVSQALYSPKERLLRAIKVVSDKQDKRRMLWVVWDLMNEPFKRMRAEGRPVHEMLFVCALNWCLEVFALVGLVCVTSRLSVWVLVRMALVATALALFALDRRVFAYRRVVTDNTLAGIVVITIFFASVSFIVLFLGLESFIEGVSAGQSLSAWAQSIVDTEGDDTEWGKSVVRITQFTQETAKSFASQYNETAWFPVARDTFSRYMEHGTLTNSPETCAGDSPGGAAGGVNFSGLVVAALENLSGLNMSMEHVVNYGGPSGKIIANGASLLASLSSLMIMVGFKVVLFCSCVFYMTIHDDFLERNIGDFLPVSQADRKKAMTTLRDALQGVLFLPCKVACLHGVVTLFSFLALQIEFPYFAAFMAVVVSVLPVVPAYIVCWPWAIVLALHGRWAMGAILAFTQHTILSAIDTELCTQGVRDANPYMTSLSSFVGFAVYGGQGVLLGPLIVCLGTLLCGSLAWLLRNFCSGDGDLPDCGGGSGVSRDADLANHANSDKHSDGGVGTTARGRLLSGSGTSSVDAQRCRRTVTLRLARHEPDAGAHKTWRLKFSPCLTWEAFLQEVQDVICVSGVSDVHGSDGARISRADFIEDGETLDIKTLSG
eukprot:g11399.t1